jgi:hypothetical protein
MTAFSNGLSIILNEINDAGGIGSGTPKFKLGMLALDDGGDYTKSLAQLQQTLNLDIMAYLSMFLFYFNFNLLFFSPPFLFRTFMRIFFISVDVPDSRLANDILALTNSTIIGIESPSGFNVTDPNNRVFNRLVINFWPTYYDQATSVLKFLARREQVGHLFVIFTFVILLCLFVVIIQFVVFQFHRVCLMA